MTKSFVVLTVNDFVSWANSTFGKDNYQVTRPKFGNELVIRYDLGIEGLEYHCYTTLDPREQVSRPKGADAIRSILFDRYSGTAAYSETKILRVEGDTGVFDRLTERYNNIKKAAINCQKQDRFCSKCTDLRPHTRTLTNSITKKAFFGCAIWYKCKEPNFNRLQYLKDQYPLAFNPFEEPTKPKLESLIIKEIHEEDYKHWSVETEQDNVELVPTTEWKYTKYPFDYFNCVQSTVYNSQVWNRDCNLILGTATSSGKTICAEMAISWILSRNKKES